MTSNNFTIKTVRKCPEQLRTITRYYTCAFAEVHTDIDGQGISVTAYEVSGQSDPMAVYLYLDGSRVHEEISVINAHGNVIERIVARPLKGSDEFTLGTKIPSGPIKRMPLNETGGTCRGGSSN